jgi:hypothetical protein
MIRRAPQQRGNAQHEFALDRGLGVVARDDRRFEAAIVFGVLQVGDHGFGGKAVPKRVAPGDLLTSQALWPGTPERISSIRCKLSPRCHWVGRSHARSDSVILRLLNGWRAGRHAHVSLRGGTVNAALMP